MKPWIIPLFIGLSITQAQAVQFNTDFLYCPGAAVCNAPGMVPLVLNSQGISEPISSSNPLVIAPSISTPTTEASGIVTTGGAFQTVLAANTSRTSCAIQNTSTHTASAYWLPTGTATALNSFQVAAGSVFNCATANGRVIQSAIQWTTATTNDPFVVTENQ